MDKWEFMLGVARVKSLPLEGAALPRESGGLPERGTAIAVDEVDRNVPGSHLIRQPTAATFPSRGRLDTQQIVHSCDFVQSHKFPFTCHCQVALLNL